MDFELTEEQRTIRREIRHLSEKYPAEYWREKDRKREYPGEFVNELAKGGWLGVTIPEEYGGGGFGCTEASIVLEETTTTGPGLMGSNACHAVFINSSLLVKHWTGEMKREYLPKIAKGELRFQVLALTEPDAGFDSTSITTSATKDGNFYIVNGKKTFISRVAQSDLMLLVARTTPRENAEKKTKGFSLFLVDLRKAGNAIERREIPNFCRRSIDTNELWINDLVVPTENLIGQEGDGFYHMMETVLNPERIFVAAECVGLGNLALWKAVEYAKQRVVFGRPIGQNQGLAFPLAQACAQIEAADLMRYKASTLWDRGQPCGREANTAKLLGSQACYEAANRAVQTLGGYGVSEEYDVERYFRESRLLLLTPISTEMVLNYISEHVLKLPRSY